MAGSSTRSPTNVGSTRMPTRRIFLISWPANGRARSRWKTRHRRSSHRERGQYADAPMLCWCTAPTMLVPFLTDHSEAYVPQRRDTALVIATPSGAVHPHVCEIGPAAFAALASLDDWTARSALTPAPEFDRLLREFKENGLVEIGGPQDQEWDFPRDGPDLSPLDQCPVIRSSRCTVPGPASSAGVYFQALFSSLPSNGRSWRWYCATGSQLTFRDQFVTMKSILLSDDPSLRNSFIPDIRAIVLMCLAMMSRTTDPKREGDFHEDFLVVDDQALIREALRGVLRHLDDVEIIFEASDFCQALRLTDENPDIDLILLDLTLPDRCGLGMLAELRESCPATSVVVMSAHQLGFSHSRCVSKCIFHALPDMARNFYAVSAWPRHERNLVMPDFATYSRDCIAECQDRFWIPCGGSRFEFL